jgi:molybdopterin synthase catalytic subunit
MISDREGAGDGVGGDGGVGGGEGGRDEGAEHPATVEVFLTDEPLESLDALRRLGTTADGATLTFEGRVRDLNEGRRVARLTYEAYREMAERELRQICEEAITRYEVAEIVAAHRVGLLELGEVSVSIAVAAPHRAPCYEASRYVIEEVKLRLPIWKHEEYTDGTASWVGAPDPPVGAGPGCPDERPIERQK